MPDISAMPDIDSAICGRWYLSLVGIPIPGPDGNLGVLYAYSRTADHFAAWGRTAVLRLWLVKLVWLSRMPGLSSKQAIMSDTWKP